MGADFYLVAWKASKVEERAADSAPLTKIAEPWNVGAVCKAGCCMG